MSYNADSPILGKGTVSAEAIQAWLDSSVEWGARVVGLPEVKIPSDMGQIIVEESARYPGTVVNHDLVASQINHESAACQSRIARDKNNFSGYGAENDDPYGKAFTFSTPRDGVRTQIAHLLGYVVGDGPWNALSPRYSIVKGKDWDGTVNVLHELEQKWAYTGAASYAVTPKENRYGAKIATHANRLLTFANDGSWDKETPLMPAPRISQSLLPAGASNKPNMPMVPTHITIHETANPASGANATMHAQWLHNLAKSGAGEPSWHFTVDSTQIIQHLRLDEMGWHAGDGANGTGNRKSIGIELCINAGADFNATMRRAAELVVWLMREHRIGIGMGAIVQHNHWSGKHCPTTIRNKGLWDDFLEMVMAQRASPSPQPAASTRRTFNVPGVGTFTLSGGFLLFWEAKGGIEIFGMPLSDELKEDGMTVQYFERARFEWHPGAVPESWDVLLTRLGADALAAKEAA